jgi:hypothetical protein
MTTPETPSDPVTWDVLWKLFGLMGGFFTILWGALMKFLWSRAGSKELEDHLDDDNRRFEELSDKIDKVEDRQDQKHKENTKRLERIENLILDVRGLIRTRRENGE